MFPEQIFAAAVLGTTAVLQAAKTIEEIIKK